MTEELDAVFFDAGGVLWDLEPSVADMFEAELSARGARVDRASLDAAVREADRLTDDRFAQVGGGDEAALWKEYDRIVLDRLGLTEVSDGLAEAMSARMRDVTGKEESWVPYPDAVPALQAVKHRDFKVGLISNATELARRVLKRLEMEEFFDVVVISDEVGVRKPDPRIFRLALGRVGVAPSRAMYFGDRPATDVVGAASAGMRGVLVDRRGTYPGSRYLSVKSLDEIRRLM